MDRGKIGSLPRLRSLEAESYTGFQTSVRRWLLTDFGPQVAASVAGLPVGREVAPGDSDGHDRRPSEKELLALLLRHPAVAAQASFQMRCQRMTWSRLHEEFVARGEDYLGELHAAALRGPGTLRLDPSLEVPDYARHDIHQQPGGYTRNAFAGFLYQYGTNSFYLDGNDDDEVHRLLAEKTATPATGELSRVLDLGCGCGQLTMALKRRFPAAEVFGIDVGAPMVSYAHKRAVESDVAVHFSQQLAERTSFAPASFDLITSYILLHEIPGPVIQRVLDEASRLLRPGGVLQIFDFPAHHLDVPPLTLLARRIDQRFNREVWSEDYHRTDLVGSLEARGFSVTPQGRIHFAVHGYASTLGCGARS